MFGKSKQFHSLLVPVSFCKPSSIWEAWRKIGIGRKRKQNSYLYIYICVCVCIYIQYVQVQKHNLQYLVSWIIFLLFNINNAHCSYKTEFPDCFLKCLAYCYPLHSLLLLFFAQCWDNAAIALSQRNYQLLKRSKYTLGIPVQRCMMWGLQLYSDTLKM